MLLLSLGRCGFLCCLTWQLDLSLLRLGPEENLVTCKWWRLRIFCFRSSPLFSFIECVQPMKYCAVHQSTINQSVNSHWWLIHYLSTLVVFHLPCLTVVRLWASNTNHKQGNQCKGDNDEIHKSRIRTKVLYPFALIEALIRAKARTLKLYRSFCWKLLSL